jgi:ABC-type amino acid transport substrate-binding protein
MFCLPRTFIIEMEYSPVKNKNLIAAAALLAAAGLVLSGCAATEEAATPEDSSATSNAPEGLMTAGTASFCIDPEYPPMEYYAEGSGGDIIGFDADLSRAIASEWGVETEFVVTAFDGLMPGLQTMKCDILLSGLYMSEARLEVADGSSYLNAGPAILTRPGDASKFNEQLDLCGVRVASQAASANSAIIVALGEECEAAGKDAPILTEYPKVAETVLALINEKADALIETNVAAAYMVTQNDGALAAAAGEIFPPDTQFGVFTRKGDALSPAVAEALRSLNTKGVVAELAAQYGLNVADINVK